MHSDLKIFWVVLCLCMLMGCANSDAEHHFDVGAPSLQSPAVGVFASLNQQGLAGKIFCESEKQTCAVTGIWHAYGPQMGFSAGVSPSACCTGPQCIPGAINPLTPMTLSEELNLNMMDESGVLITTARRGIRDSYQGVGRILVRQPKTLHFELAGDGEICSLALNLP